MTASDTSKTEKKLIQQFKKVIIKDTRIDFISKFWFQNGDGGCTGDVLSEGGALQYVHVATHVSAATGVGVGVGVYVCDCYNVTHYKLHNYITTKNAIVIRNVRWIVQYVTAIFCRSCNWFLWTASIDVEAVATGFCG